MQDYLAYASKMTFFVTSSVEGGIHLSIPWLRHADPDLFSSPTLALRVWTWWGPEAAPPLEA